MGPARTRDPAASAGTPDPAASAGTPDAASAGTRAARRLRIGLTGGIASGKSTVAARFAAHGIPVIDADEAARAVVEPGSAALVRIVERFGKEVLEPGGALDRRAMRERIFADPRARRDLEAILHPLIGAEMEARERAAAGPYVIMAIPLLIEAGGPRGRVDRVLVVDVDEAVQVARVAARDGHTPEQARAILAAQAGREQRLDAADDVIANAGSIADLHRETDRLHEKYLRLSGC
ncbi:MAG TPA: dephospho-CoA kinase [Steroidobacteraceae bacterium]|jgi:dephospho-CoA kinase|nr:dephospho-CoA kinase [Steroidobacteraceae bacterium]